jgi:hypothetical protein
VLAFVKEGRKNAEWEQLLNKTQGGFMGLLTSGAGLAAAFSGSDTMQAVMEVFSDKEQAFHAKAGLMDTGRGCVWCLRWAGRCPRYYRPWQRGVWLE